MRRLGNSEKYITIYNNLRKEQIDTIVELRKEVRELSRMVEFLCKVVFEE